MPNTWALVESSFPTFTQGDDPQAQIAALVDYMMILTEALKYQLENLDANNWNRTALDSFRLDTTKDVSEQLGTIAEQLSAVVNEVASIKTRLSTTEARTAQIEMDISYLEKEQEDTAQDLAELQEQMGNAQADVDALQEMIAQDAEGNIVLGKVGQKLYLVGEVYVNDVLLE